MTMSSEEKLKLSVKSDLCILTLMEVDGAASVNKTNEYLAPILTGLMDMVSHILEEDLLEPVRKTAWPSKLSQMTAQGCVSRYLNVSFEEAVDEFLFSTSSGLKVIVEQLCSSSSIQDLNDMLDDLVDDYDALDEFMVSFLDNSEDARTRGSNLREAIYPNDQNQPRLHFEKLTKENVMMIQDAYARYTGSYLLRMSSVQASERTIGKSIFEGPYTFNVTLAGEDEKFYKMKFQIDLLPPEVPTMKEILVFSEADKLMTYMLEMMIVNPKDIHRIIKQMEIPRTLAMEIGNAFDSLRGKYEEAKAVMSLPPHV